MNDALAPQSAQSAVPQGYAEKAMASLMQLHTELMDEKERRVELYRRLMEREQSLAEMKSYARALEEKLAALSPPQRTEQPERETASAQATPPPPRAGLRAAPPLQARHPATPPPLPRIAPRPQPQPQEPQRQAVAVGAGRAPARGVPDGWKTW